MNPAIQAGHDLISLIFLSPHPYYSPSIPPPSVLLSVENTGGGGNTTRQTTPGGPSLLFPTMKGTGPPPHPERVLAF